jgi:LmbE family N-acetylglucosaminyl deacetylase
MINVGLNNVILTAHPDDEVLWCGGLPLAFADRMWTVICCSIPRVDEIRRKKFVVACERLGITQTTVLPFTETNPNEPLSGLDTLDLKPFDTIVTHNKWGEYGHAHHKSVNAHVIKHWKSKSVITFGYRDKGEGKEKLELSEEQFKRKMFALRAYDHVSPTDRKPKWEALEEVYYRGKGINPAIETYDNA